MIWFVTQIYIIYYSNFKVTCSMIYYTICNSNFKVTCSKKYGLCFVYVDVQGLEFRNLYSIKLEDLKRNFMENQLCSIRHVKLNANTNTQLKKTGATDKNSKGICHKCGKHYYVQYYLNFYYAVPLCCYSFILPNQILLYNNNFLILCLFEIIVDIEKTEANQ